MQRLLAFLFMLAAGCGGQVANDDGAADEAALAGDGKADTFAVAVTGIYQLVGDPAAAGDIEYLWLTGNGFAWTRCYDAGCAAPVIEDGSYKLTTSSGKKYISFYQAGSADDTKTHFNSMYAYSRSGKTLKLRLTRGSRWMTLASVAESELCTASGGTWAGGCNCGAGWPMSYSPGAGGCWIAPAAGESACDDTRGIYSDDETNLAGTFCDCGFRRHLEERGCVANAF